MKIIYFIIDLLTYFINSIDKQKQKEKHEKKEDKINESREDPEKFFKDHFSNSHDDDSDGLSDDDKNK